MDASIDARADLRDAQASDAGPTVDAAITFDAGGRDAGPMSHCTHDGFPRAFSSTRANATILEHAAINNLAGDPTDVLVLQRFYELGAFINTSPQLITLRDESYATCSTCVLVFYQCTPGATIYDIGSCAKTFLARSGVVELTTESAAGGPLRGVLHDIELVEVTIDPTTYESTAVPGGETWCIGTYVFDDEVIDPYM